MWSVLQVNSFFFDHFQYIGGVTLDTNRVVTVATATVGKQFDFLHHSNVPSSLVKIYEAVWTFCF